MKFRVDCKPVPQGGHRAFVVKTKSGMNRAVITDSNGQAIHSMRAMVAEAYRDAGGINYGDKAIKLDVTFAFTRPKSVNPKKRPHYTVKPDIDKLLRAALDSLTGHAFKDDSQVVSLSARKIYADEEYIEMDIDEYTEGLPQQMTLRWLDARPGNDVYPNIVFRASDLPIHAI